nr:MAG TPA: hypothetical protein [Caudoviricetes sp.]
MVKMASMALLPTIKTQSFSRVSQSLKKTLKKFLI